MIKTGTVIFKTPDTETAGDDARVFCRSRGLSTDDAKIVRRRGHIEVEIKRPCVLKIKS